MCRTFVACSAAVVLLLVACDAGAQTEEEARWEISVTSGVEEVASRDDKGSPLAYSGLGYPLGLQLLTERPSWSGGVQASGFAFVVNGGRLASGQATPGEEGHQADSIFVDLSVWAQLPVLRRGAHRLDVGAEISHWTFFRSYTYHAAQIGAVETWDAPVAVGGRVEWSRHGQWLDLDLGATVALVGRMMRPAHSLRGDERFRLIESRHRVFTYGRWVAPHRLRWVQGRAGMRAKVHPRWGLWAQYRIGWMDYRERESSRASSQRGLGGLYFRF